MVKGHTCCSFIPKHYVLQDQYHLLFVLQVIVSFKAAIFCLFISGESGAGVADEGSDIAEGDGEAKNMTKKPAPVPLPEDTIVMQVDCGTFHTGRWSLE